MEKVLFITSRNIFTTSGELRLIKNRAEKLFSEYRICTDFLAIAKSSRINAADREDIICGGTLDGISMSFKNPFSVLIAYKRLLCETKRKIQSNNYVAIILSGPGIHLLASHIRKYSKIKIIIDCHGASETSSAVSKYSGTRDKIWYTGISYLDKYSLKRGFKNCNGALVVSQALENYMRKRYRVNNEIPFYIIPCATTDEGFSEKTYLEFRKMYRERLGINEEIVFVYSGGVSSWQCIDESIEMFKKISEILCVPTKMLIFSHKIETIKNKISEDTRIICDSYQPEELQKVLCAGDYAFLIRKESVVNFVAFPNKFLEYIKSRMYVITTPHIDEIAKQVNYYNIGFVYSFSQDVKAVAEYVQNNMINGISYDISKKVLDNNSFSNRLKPFSCAVNDVVKK